MSNNFSKKTEKYFCDCVAMDKAEPHKPYVIVSCDLPSKLQNRFAELGLVAGATVTIIKTAPLGDPLEIRVMGYSLCARAKDLKHFKVARLKNE